MNKPGQRSNFLLYALGILVLVILIGMGIRCSIESDGISYCPKIPLRKRLKALECRKIKCSPEDSSHCSVYMEHWSKYGFSYPTSKDPVDWHFVYNTKTGEMYEYTTGKLFDKSDDGLYLVSSYKECIGVPTLVKRQSNLGRDSLWRNLSGNQILSFDTKFVSSLCNKKENPYSDNDPKNYGRIMHEDISNYDPFSNELSVNSIIYRWANNGHGGDYVIGQKCNKYDIPDNIAIHAKEIP